MIHLLQSRMKRNAHWAGTKKEDHHKSQLKGGLENTFRVNISNEIEQWTVPDGPCSLKAVQFVKRTERRFEQLDENM